jgi:hypothetical protein
MPLFLMLAFLVRPKHPLCRRSLLVLRTGRFLFRRSPRMIPPHQRRTALIPGKSGMVWTRCIMNITWDLHQRRHPISMVRWDMMIIMVAG